VKFCEENNINEQLNAPTSLMLRGRKMDIYFHSRRFKITLIFLIQSLYYNKTKQTLIFMSYFSIIICGVSAVEESMGKIFNDADFLMCSVAASGKHILIKYNS
jgi:hypothetical protein